MQSPNPWVPILVIARRGRGPNVAEKEFMATTLQELQSVDSNFKVVLYALPILSLMIVNI